MKFIVTSTKCGFDPKNLYDGYPWLCLCDYIIEENLPKVDGNLVKVLTLNGDEKQTIAAFKDMSRLFDKELILDFRCKNYPGFNYPLVEIYDTYRE